MTCPVCKCAIVRWTVEQLKSINYGPYLPYRETGSECGCEAKHEPAEPDGSIAE